jgi:hypothetical protein
VGNFTTVSAASAVFTTATITTVNTTTLDLTNLEVTNIKAKDGTASMVIDDATGKVNVTTVSAASMNAGVAAVTTLTATGASVASANLGVAVVTNLTATGASVASMNAGVALFTNATVTTLNATGASIASANIGNLQFTAASIASINAGVAVITNLTATSASIASMNAGVAILTTATVTNLTATGASVASANVGTAVITGLTVTGASIASVNAGTATLSGNLTLSGGTANGVLYLNASKVATSGSALVFDGTNLGVSAPAFDHGPFVVGANTNTVANITVINSSSGTAAQSRVRVGNGGANFGTITHTGASFTTSGIFRQDGTYVFGNGAGGLTLTTGANQPIYFAIDVTEQMRLTSTGLGIGTSSPVGKLQVSGANDSRVALINGATKGVRFNIGSSGSSIEGVDNTGAGSFQPLTIGGSTVNFSISGSDKVFLDTSGNLGLGVTPSAWSGFKAIDVNTISSFASATNRLQVAYNSYWNGSNYIYKTTAEAARYDMITGQHQWYTAPSGTAGNTISFTQAMTLDSGGRLLIGRTTSDANNYRIQISQGTATYGSGIQFVYEGVGAAAIWENSSGALVFGNDGADGDTERARITSGGYFKASDDGAYGGSVTGFHEFNQSAAGQGVLTLYGDNASTTAAGMLFIETARNTTNNTYYAISYYNTGAAAYKFRVADSGDVTNTNGTYGTISDAKMKTDIVDAGSQWDDIKALRFRKFKMKDDPAGLIQLGVVAQEVEQVSPGLVDEHIDRDGEGNDLGTTTKSVKTSVLLMKAAVALQEAMARIEKLEAEMAALKGA